MTSPKPWEDMGMTAEEWWTEHSRIIYNKLLNIQDAVDVLSQLMSRAKEGLAVEGAHMEEALIEAEMKTELALAIWKGSGAEQCRSNTKTS